MATDLSQQPKPRGRPRKTATTPAVPPAPPVPSANSVTEPSAPSLKERLLKVKTKGVYPINCYPVGVMIYPGSIYEVPDHRYVRRQIELGTLEEV